MRDSVSSDEHQRQARQSHRQPGLAVYALRLSGERRALAVVCNGYGPAASLVPAIEALGVEVTTVTAGEHAAACGRLVDLVERR